MEWSKSGKSVTRFGHGPDVRFFGPKLGQSQKFLSLCCAIQTMFSNNRNALQIPQGFDKTEPEESLSIQSKSLRI
jgi:hypothetical protein